MAPSRLDPRNDVVFKLLFARNEDLLKALLGAVLRPVVPIAHARVQNPELPKAYSDDKGSFLDIRVRLADGTLLDVEMQSVRRPALRGRALYYWAKLFGSQLATGQDYSALAPVISVLFLNYRELISSGFHEIFRLQTQSHQLFSPLLEIHTIELTNLLVEEDEQALVRWCRFLTVSARDELARLAEEDPMIAKAEQVLSEISADQQAREQALDRELAEASVKIMRGAERQEGRIEGRIEAQRELLERFLSRRFGELSEAHRNHLGSASLTQLEAYTERAFDAQSLDDVLKR